MSEPSGPDAALTTMSQGSGTLPDPPRQARGVRWRRLAVAVLLMGLLSAGGALVFRQHLARIATSPSSAPPTPEEEARGRMESASREGRIMLLGQTREVLPAAVESIRLEAVPGGVLEHAFGVDPFLAELGEGDAELAWELRSAGGEVLWSEERRVSVAKPENAGWHELEVVLPDDLSGPPHLVLLRKKVELEGWSGVSGIAASELLYWARPVVRPVDLPERPNLVFVSVDTLRADHLSFMGYGRETSPHVDRLAAGGVAFLSCYSQAPWTTPAHFSILTGLAPHRHGADLPYQRLARGWDRHRDTLADLLRRAGYVTRSFTAAGPMSASFGFDDGFDVYEESAGDDVEAMVEKARSWLRGHADRTFFLFLHTFEPHEPYEDGYFVDREGIPESETWAQKVARYDGDIRRTDHHLGRLFAELEELGLWDSTLVVLTSDHGEELDDRLEQTDWTPWHHGHSLYDEVLHVPLVFGGGMPIPAGLRIGAQVRSIDIAPTLLDYAGLPVPSEIQGRSLRPLIQGRADEPRPVLAEATTYGTERIAVRTPEHKLIRRVSRGQLGESANEPFPLTPELELYDLRSDPAERRNLADGDRELLRRLQELLDTLRKESAESSPEESLEDDVRLRRELEALGYVD